MAQSALLECSEGEDETLTAMVQMSFSSCYSKEASKWCQVTAVFKKKSQMSGTEEAREADFSRERLAHGWQQQSTGCWNTQCPGGCETPAVGPKLSEHSPALAFPSPAAKSLLPAQAGPAERGQMALESSHLQRRWGPVAPSQALPCGVTVTLPDLGLALSHLP